MPDSQVKPDTRKKLIAAEERLAEVVHRLQTEVLPNTDRQVSETICNIIAFAETGE